MMITDTNKLPLEVAQELDGICDQFELDFQAGQLPQIEAFLDRVSDDKRDSLLCLLFQIEIELRTRQDTLPPLESYIQRFPTAARVIKTIYSQRGEQSTDPPQTPHVATQTVSNRCNSRNTSISGVLPDGSSDSAVAALEHIGRFNILKVLGEGAFGTVFLADDPQLDRKVAIKVPHARSLATPAEAERFLREARSAATLRHPNICPVYEVNEQNGLQYIVMGYIEGIPLTEFVRKNKPLAQRQVAIIIRKLARTLELAHARGVVHRDLKPDNIMIEREHHEPVIMDFGLARRDRVDEVQLTQIGQIMGTPTYMPPEQARGDLANIGPASDIYSLGVIFYEFLSGKRPFTGNIGEVLGGILHTKPQPPSSHRKGIDPQLEAICLKCMPKRVKDRYASMGELDEALTEYLREYEQKSSTPSLPGARSRSEPKGGANEAGFTPFFESQATEQSAATCAPTRRNDFWKNLSPAAKWATAFACIGVCLAAITLIVPTAEGDLTVTVSTDDLKVVIDGEMIEVTDEKKWTGKQKATKHQLALKFGNTEIPFDKSREAFVYEGRKLIVKIGNVELKSNRFEVTRNRETVITVEFTEKVLPVQADMKPGTILWEDHFETNRLGEYENADMWKVADGVLIAQGTNGTLENVGQFDLLLPFRISGDAVAEYKVVPHGENLRAANFFLGNVEVHYGGNNNTHSWIRRLVAGGKIEGQRTRVVIPSDRATAVQLMRIGNRILFSVDGQIIRTFENATLQSDPPAKLGFLRYFVGPDVAYDDLLVRRPTLQDYKLAGVEIPQPWKHLTVGFIEKSESVLVKTFIGPTGRLRRAIFSPNEKQVLSGGVDKIIRLWDIESGMVFSNYTGHTEEVTSLQFIANGRRFVSASADNSLHVWDVATREVILDLKGHTAVVYDFEVLADETQVLSCSHDRTLRLWDLKTGSTIREFERQDTFLRRISVSPDGTLAVTGSGDVSPQIWNIETGKVIRRLRGHTRQTTAVDFSSDGKQIVTGSYDRTIRIWNAESGELIKLLTGHIAPVHHVEFSDDDGSLVSGSLDGDVITWDAATGRLINKLVGHTDRVFQATFSKDAKHILSCGEDATIRLWRSNH